MDNFLQWKLSICSETVTNFDSRNLCSIFSSHCCLRQYLRLRSLFFSLVQCCLQQSLMLFLGPFKDIIIFFNILQVVYYWSNESVCRSTNIFLRFAITLSIFHLFRVCKFWSSFKSKLKIFDIETEVGLKINVYEIFKLYTLYIRHVLHIT